MPLDVNIANTVFSKQIYDAGVRAACDQFMHCIGGLMASKRIRLEEHLEETIFTLSARELSDLIGILFEGETAEVVAFLKGPRDAAPR